MNTGNDNKSNKYRRSVISGMTAAVLLTLVLVTSTVYAWLNTSRRLAAITHVTDPTAIFITAGHQEEIKYLNLGGIDVEEGGAPLPGDSGKKYRDYVFCIKGIGVISYKIQLAHTTNNQFEFKLYAATETAGDPLAGNQGAVPFIIHDPLESDASIPDAAGNPANVSVGDTIYYSIPSGAAEIPMTPLNKKSGELLGKNDDGYYTKTYDGYSASKVNEYAVPIYWHTVNAIGVDASDIEFYDYYILRVVWPADAKNDKETDILYISAKNTND